MLVPEEILGAKFSKVKSDTLSSDGLPYALNVLFITFFSGFLALIYAHFHKNIFTPSPRNTFQLGSFYHTCQ